MITPAENYGRVAVLSAGLLTIAAICCGSLGLWRLGTDVKWTETFVIEKGLLSHWQVWMGVAAGMRYTSRWLFRYAETLRRHEVETVFAV